MALETLEEEIQCEDHQVDNRDSEGDDTNKENVGGHPSLEKLQVQDEGLSRIINAVTSLATKLGPNPVAILKFLVSRLRATGGNTWPWYQRYYKGNEKEELKQLPDCNVFASKCSLLSMSLVANNSQWILLMDVTRLKKPVTNCSSRQLPTMPTSYVSGTRWRP